MKGKLLAVEVEDDDESVDDEVSVLSLAARLLFTMINYKLLCFETIRLVPMLIPVDSGTIHNFISQRLIHKLGSRHA